MLRRRAAAVLVGWTFLVWTTRLRNIWADEALSDGEKWGRTALALSFTVLAVVVVVGLVRRTAWHSLAVRLLAGWTVGVWGVRSIGIASADHEAAFVVVHLVLAAVSIGLAGLAVWTTDPASQRPDAVTAPR